LAGLTIGVSKDLLGSLDRFELGIKGLEDEFVKQFTLIVELAGCAAFAMRASLRLRIISISFSAALISTGWPLMGGAAVNSGASICETWGERLDKEAWIMRDRRDRRLRT
jgi:hypothetical protein